MTDAVLTEFNSSVATLVRIDEALKGARVACIDNDLDLWLQYLHCIKRESYPKMDKKGCEKCGECTRCKCLKRFDSVENKLMVVTRSSSNKKNLLREIRRELDLLELSLRDFMDSKGMLMTNSNSAKLALQRG